MIYCLVSISENIKIINGFFEIPTIGSKGIYGVYLRDNEIYIGTKDYCVDILKQHIDLFVEHPFVLLEIGNFCNDQKLIEVGISEASKKFQNDKVRISWEQNIRLEIAKIKEKKFKFEFGKTYPIRFLPNNPSEYLNIADGPRHTSHYQITPKHECLACKLGVPLKKVESIDFLLALQNLNNGETIVNCSHKVKKSGLIYEWFFNNEIVHTSDDIILTEKWLSKIIRR